MEKQIEKIIEILSIRSICIYKEKVKAAKEIAVLYKGWYPGKFVEWKDRRCVYRPMTNTYNVVMEGLIMTLPELFRWWQDNVEGK